MPDSFSSIFQQAFAENAKSTVLRPLGWLISIAGVLSVSAYRFGAPVWLGAMFGVFSGLGALVYLVGYIYFGIKDPELLRTEKYSLHKMAIQRGFVGDSISGVIKLKDVPPGEVEDQPKKKVQLK